MLATKLKVVSNNGSQNPVYRSLKRFSVDGVGDLIRVLMDSVDDSLFELADKVDNDRQRNMYFEAMREIRLKRESIKQTFDEEMARSFDRAAKSRTETDPEDDDATELTLLEYEDLEDDIAIRNMVSRARPQFEDELFAVSERLKLVLKIEELKDDDNPLDPNAICKCFHNAAECLDTDIEVKLIFYKLFERYVIKNLGHFYGEVNEFFVKKGVLPGFKVDQERMRQTTRFMANRIRKNAETVAASSAPAAMPGVEGGNLFATLQQAVTGSGQGSPVISGGGGYATAAGAQGAAGGGMPGGGAGGGVAGGGAGGGVAGGGSATGGAPMASGDLVTALGNLQTVALANQPVASIDPQNLRAVTQQQVISFREQYQHQFNGTDNQTIDVVSMLFDFFFDDDALPAPIKVLIGRLQIPILKVAMLDKDFFNHKKHPARKLLDSISRASLGFSDQPGAEQALIDATEEIVNFVVNEFDADVGVFEEAWTRLENFVRQQESESQQAQQEIARQEQQKDLQIEAAHEATANLIGKLIGKRDLSFEVTDFLETTWSSVLFNAYLSLGEDSNHWRNLQRISTTFVWTLLPKHSEAERVKIIKTIPALLRALSKGMELIRIKPDVQNRIFEILAGEHARVVKLTSRNIVTRVDDTTVWPEDDGAGQLAENAVEDSKRTAAPTGAEENHVHFVDCEDDDDFIALVSSAMTEEVIDDLNLFTAGVKQGEIVVDEEIVMETAAEEDDFDFFDEGGEDCLARAQALEIGNWVEFTDSASSEPVIARLSWKSNVTGNLVFVNRQGQKVRNTTVNSFAQDLASGAASTVESSSVFDRAIYTIMSKMQH